MSTDSGQKIFKTIGKVKSNVKTNIFTDILMDFFIDFSQIRKTHELWLSIYTLILWLTLRLRLGK